MIAIIPAECEIVIFPHFAIVTSACVFCFSAPLSLLYDCAGPVMQCSEAFTELVQKCIWKKTRMIAANIARIEMGPILLICNDFFNSYPRNYWKNKPNDKPLRTVKTVVVTLVQQAPERVSFILRIYRRLPN